MKEDYKLKRNNFSKNKEILSKRGKREKHFLQKDGTIVAQMYLDDIHFEKNGKFEEIDNTLEKVGNYYKNKNNSFNGYFKNVSMGKMMGYELPEGHLSISLPNNNNVLIDIVEDESKLNQIVKYKEIFDGIDFEYKITPTKVKENIIIKSKEALLDEINFKIETDLELKLNADGSIIALKDNNILFNFEKPFMIDDNNKINYNPIYELQKKDYGYDLNLILDNEWLKNGDVKYPVIIDPTIIETNDSIMDTYIYPGDNNVSRGEQEILKAGVELVDNNEIINRTLIKFILPEIGAGSQITEALLNLTFCPIDAENATYTTMGVHQITCDWNESNASWETMNDKINSNLSALFFGNRSEYYNGSIDYFTTECDLTELVRNWYLGTTNYGILIKSYDESLNSENVNDFPIFYSTESTINDDYKPKLVIKYKNNVGLEDYMSYQSQSFNGANSYENIYNGNLFASFDLGEIKNKDIVIDLKLIYNSNDSVEKKDYGFGTGYRLNLQQTINLLSMNELNYLQYVDETGNIHYFEEITTDTSDYEIGTFVDENNKKMIIKKDGEDYVLYDENGMKKIFSKTDDIYNLKKIEDNIGSVIEIIYNSSGLVTKVKITNGQEISISYNLNNIEIVTPSESVIIYYENSLPINITRPAGVLSINYNNINLIEKIIDTNETSIAYEYYELKPYRLKKVIEYGKNNTLGMFFTLNYFNNATRITNNNGHTIITNFNDNGFAISSCQMNNLNDISNAFVTLEEYGDKEQYKNKLLSSKIPFGYIKNYLTNISFEKDEISFVPSELTTLELTEEYSVSGNKSLKAVSNGEFQHFSKKISILKGKYYTFSAYIKNNQKMKLSLEYKNINNETISSSTKALSNNNDFERHDVTIYYPEDALSELNIKFEMLSSGVAYIDDIQLEEGEVVNDVNFFENSDLTEGMSDWIVDTTDTVCQVVEIDNKKALKLDAKVNEDTRLEKYIKMNGKINEKYTLGFWYKNNGSSRKWNKTLFNIENYPYAINPGGGSLNATSNEWQYYSKTITAVQDFENLYLKFSQLSDFNSLYITNFTLHKEIAEENYDYDEQGNIKSINDFNNEVNEFKYDKTNQLINCTDSEGRANVFEYDNLVSNRELTNITSSGVSTSKKYDSFGNVISSKMCNKFVVDDLDSGVYKIRAKGSEYYLNYINGLVKLSLNCGRHVGWNIEKVDDFYKLKFSMMNQKYLCVKNNSLIISNYDESFSLFTFEKRENGSYLIKSNATEHYLKNNNGILELADYDEGNESYYQFYIEVFEEKIFMEENTEYTADGSNETARINYDLTKTSFQIDSETGLVISKINAKNQRMFYEYNSDKKISHIKNDDMQVSLDYNDNGNVKKIYHGQKEYNFEYNNFLKNTSIKLGNDITLVTNNYVGGSDNLSSIVYGNGHTEAYEYDDFERIIKITKMDDVYNYRYNNNNQLVKIISNNCIVKNSYNEAKKLVEYNYDDLRIKYAYGKNDKIVNRIYWFDNFLYSIDITYNKEDAITKTSFDTNEIHYTYDELGRIISNSINNKINVNYEYVTNGKRTTPMIKNMCLNGDKYSYKYDKLNNITHIYHGTILENRYYYDKYNQLIKEDNYLTNQTTRYKYDNLGNLLLKTIYKLNTYDYISQNKYQYNNVKWEDQLTKFNNKEITYDIIGNPLTIGNNVTMSWINGRELHNYQDLNLSLIYKYNEDGIRTKKICNGIATDYYLENNQVVIEKNDNNVLYYIRDEVNDLIGFKYNDVLYYYVKNAQGDIIAILDGNYNTVAKYQYDSWGNIVAITDENGVNVSNNSTHIANINPYRYRSYYYDKETNLYYLESRYYSPEMGRFINADSTEILKSDVEKFEFFTNYNLYNYASNNPINVIDPFGDNPLPLILATILTGLRRFGSWVVRSAWTKANRWFRKNVFNILKRNRASYGGIKIGPVSIMLHKPHTGKHNFYHIQIEIRYGRVRKIYRIRVWI